MMKVYIVAVVEWCLNHQCWRAQTVNESASRGRDLDRIEIASSNGLNHIIDNYQEALWHMKNSRHP